MSQLMALAESLGRDAKLSRTELQMLLEHNYLQEYFGLKVDRFNLNMPLVEMMPEANIFRLTRWSSRVEEFATNNIHATFGLSLADFLNLPTVQVEHLLYIRRKQAEEERRLSEKAKREADARAANELPPGGITGFTQLDF